MTSDAGYVLGPLALGLLADIFGPIPALLAAAALLVLVGVAFAVMAPETHSARAKS